MPVGEEDGFSRQIDLFFDGDSDAPAIAVARNQAEGQRGVVPGHLLGVVHHVSQVDHLLGLVEVDGGIHPGQGAVGVGKD